jgi:hypothetical protein
MSVRFRIRQWFRIRYLDRERRKSAKSLPRFHERLIIEDTGSPDEIAAMHEAEKFHEQLADSVIILKWMELRSQAAGLGLFVNWSEPRPDQLLLDRDHNPIRKEMAELRLAIRKERNERWQFWELRLKVVVQLAFALTGALGAAIGLVATLKR